MTAGKNKPCQSEMEKWGQKFLGSSVKKESNTMKKLSGLVDRNRIAPITMGGTIKTAIRS